MSVSFVLGVINATCLVAGIVLFRWIVRTELSAAMCNEKWQQVPVGAFNELRDLTLSLAHIARVEHERGNETKAEVEKLQKSKKAPPSKVSPKKGKNKAKVGQKKVGALK